MSGASPEAPATAAAWSVWARAEHAQGRIAQAEAGFRRALAMDAAWPLARFGLASVMLETGDVAGAAAVAAPLLAKATDHCDLLWLQARLAQAQGRSDDARAALERLLRDPGLTAPQRAEALLAFGIALDELGDTAAAFAAAREGKAILRAFHASEAAAREGEVAKLTRIAGWLKTTAPRWPTSRRQAVAQPDPGAACHVFLLGFPRSGTTLLENVLASHPRVAALEEAPLLAAAYQAFLSDGAACEALLALSDPEAAAWAEHYWTGIRQRGVDVAGKVFVDKQPAGTLNLPIIARLFPEARILFALRDPRDVVLSCFRQAFQINAMTYAFTHLGESAACYAACMTLAERARGRLPLAWRDVRHEALVADFAAEMAGILDFVGLARDEALADFAAPARRRVIWQPPRGWQAARRRPFLAWTERPGGSHRVCAPIWCCWMMI